MKRTPLRKRSKNYKPKVRYDRGEMLEMFLRIWRKRGPYSQISGERIPGEPLTIYFDHLLPKETYPHLACDERNVIIVTAAEHESRTMGHALPRHREYIKEARKLLWQ